jgi:3-(3-hydroxy-phenyl)propionate hydroxylase
VPRFEPTRPTELDGPQARHGVVIVGAGPVGLVAALDLAAHGIPCVIINDDDTVSIGSRAICWAKRTLEILDRLGLAAPLVERGVTWQTGKVFSGERGLYTFDLADDGRQQFPAFINLQQYHVEAELVAAVDAEPLIDLRWKNRLAGITQAEDHVALAVETPFGNYTMQADWVIAADGARSEARRLLGLDFLGRVFEDRFLIADVVMRAEFPSQRWFWFDPPFNPEQSALLHRQADNVWRIDMQLGPDADPEREREPAQVIPRIRRMLGPDVPFDLEWTSVYTFKCRRLESFRSGRVLFAGDSAHQVSPFGARGANSGVQDVDNLVWKLALVLVGEASEALLDSYDAERIPAADENILNSSRSTDFITPKSNGSRALRDATLDLATDWPFARALVNSGRLSRPATYRASPINGSGAALIGAPCPDVPLTLLSADGEREIWLLSLLGGEFTLLSTTGAYVEDMPCIAVAEIPIAGTVTVRDDEGRLAALFGEGVFLFRPDQHLTATWSELDAAAVREARERACGGSP